MGKYTLPATYDNDTADFIAHYLRKEFCHIFDVDKIALFIRIYHYESPNIIYECEENYIDVETNDLVNEETLKKFVTMTIINGFYDLYLKYNGREKNG